MGKKKPPGCFTWVVSLGQRINQRCAAARNALILRFRKKNKDKATKELVNDTGTPDLVFSKRPVTPQPEEARLKSPPSSLDRLVANVEEKELEVPVTGSLNNAVASLAPAATQPLNNGEASPGQAPSPTLSHSGASLVPAPSPALSNAETSSVEEATPVDVTKTECDAVAVASMTSSIVSDIADAAVTHSLSNIAPGRDPEPCSSMTSSVISDLAEAAVHRSLTSIVGNSNESARVPNRGRRMTENFADMGLDYHDENAFRKKKTN